jgi:hypothetical protein
VAERNDDKEEARGPEKTINGDGGSSPGVQVGGKTEGPRFVKATDVEETLTHAYALTAISDELGHLNAAIAIIRLRRG